MTRRCAVQESVIQLVLLLVALLVAIGWFYGKWEQHK